MPDAVPRTYRVTFVHRHNGTRYEALVTVWHAPAAQHVAAVALEQHLSRTAGHVADWAHESTEEIAA